MKRIVIFASGSGSNAQRITEYFAASDVARVVAIFSNRADAFVLQRAISMNIPTVIFNKSSFYESGDVLGQLLELQPDIIVLAGFLWRVPEKILRSFPDKIVNIHPALLPKYGGKGMYGKHVHHAVISGGEEESGITIHCVNENYDEGAHIFQATCAVDKNDTPDMLAEKIHDLEFEYFPKIIEQILTGR